MTKETAAPSLDKALIFPQLIHRRATSVEHGTRPFLRSIDGDWKTYAEIDESTRRWAHALGSIGVDAGDRVAVMLPTSIESITIWLACGWRRAFEVPIHVEYRGSIFRHVLDHSSAEVLIIAERYVQNVAAVFPELSALRKVIVVPDTNGEADISAIDLDWGGEILQSNDVLGATMAANEGPDYWDTGAIVYTSGTTGPPKGVMVPWQQFYKHGEIFFPLSDMSAEDCFYCPLPLSHIAGRVAIYNLALAGGRVVLRDKFSIEAFWGDIADFNCTSALLIGSIAEMLWRRPPNDADPSTPLRKVLMAPLIPQVEEFKKRFDLRVRTQFGMTETMAPLVSGVTNDWDLANTSSCGRVLSGFECRIADENDGQLPVNEIGELLIRSNDPWMIMAGYWRDPENTARAFRNQWFHTGDAFRSDEDGNYYFIDRMKDTIRRRGENISSFLVEQAISEHPDVADCAVVGVDSSFTEQEIHAFVVMKAGAKLEEKLIEIFLKESLPMFMIPYRWSTIEALPRTPTQRVKKAELRMLLQAEGKTK